MCLYPVNGRIPEDSETYWQSLLGEQAQASMDQNDPLQQAGAIATAIEQLADQLRPDVIRAARRDETGRRDLDRIEYALGTIGKALILTDYSIDEEKDIDKLKAFRESQKGMG